ncbi:hypothetical protein PG995_015430 [Apiospora arundinis]|uniref:GNAT family N-acetyltransferase n=1 Tax=Apiospora arundinis TaxID=335852 RepID=A0ABR2IFE9_9PEZI
MADAASSTQPATMDYRDFTKRLVVPAGFQPPSRLRHETLVATPLKREHVREDLTAVNSSRDLIRQTRGGSWPEEELTEEFNLLDLAWHEREFRDLDSFAYVVHETSATGAAPPVYVGCFYLYPMGSRTPLLNKDLVAYDVDASWWVSADAYERGHYERLYRGLVSWLETAFPFFAKPYFSNKAIPQ